MEDNIVTNTTNAPDNPIAVKNGIWTTERPANPIITVMAAKTTELPAVALAIAIDSVRS
ncbi:hypothetical protein D3C80_1986490 [compost metagenome]